MGENGERDFKCITILRVFHHLHAALILLFDPLAPPKYSTISIAKDDDHQIEIVSNQDVMQQMIGCLHNKRIKVNYCLYILSCNSSTHQHLCNLRLISGVMSASDWLVPEAQFGDMDPALCTKLERELAA